MMDTTDMFARRREKIDLFKSVPEKEATVQANQVPEDLYTNARAAGCRSSPGSTGTLRVCPHCGAPGVLDVRTR